MSESLSDVQSGVAQLVDALHRHCDAGLGLNGAFEQALKELTDLPADLRGHLEDAHRRMMLEPDRLAVLRELADRAGSKDLELLVMMLCFQARTGHPLIETLRHQAEDIRTRGDAATLEGQWPTLLHVVHLLTEVGVPAVQALSMAIDLAPRPGRDELVQVLSRVEKGLDLAAALEY